MKRYVLTLITILCLSANALAQSFFNLTADEVKIDSLLPCFTHQVELGANYADSLYEVSIEYPEFIDMSAADIARYQRITTDELPEMPVVSHYTAVSRKQGTLDISFVPLVKRNGRYQKLVSFMLKVQARPRVEGAARRAYRAASAADRYAAHSVLASGQWVKIKVPTSGVYQLTDQLIKEAGFTDLSKVKVYGYGGAAQPEALTGGYLTATDDLKEVPTYVSGNRRLFYAVGPVNWASSANTDRLRQRNCYSSYGYYFLTENDATAKTVDEQTFKDSFYPGPNDYHSMVEPEEFAWYHGGRNLYAKTALSSTASSYTLDAPSQSATLSVTMTYNGYCEAEVAVNGTTVGSIVVSAETVNKGVSYFGPKTTYSSMAGYTWHFDVSNLNVGQNTVTLKKTSGATTTMRLDHITLTFDTPKGLADLNTTTFSEPTVVGKVNNQDHHADTPVDMVIIIPASRKLQAQAERLKQLHESKDALRVRIVAADELYNEFSSGTPEGNAYRRYLKMLYDRATTENDMPRYLLLLGDCAWDNRMLCSEWNAASPDDYLLAYESENSFSIVYCYVSDDYFCLLDDGEEIAKYIGKPDVAVGRIPVRTEDEAKAVVDKIESYRNNEYAGDWQNLVCIMGDDGDNNQHMEAANDIATIIETQHPAFQIRKVYWDAYPRVTTTTGNSYPAVRSLVRQQMRDGALLMNYSGHGGPASISHEMVLQLSDFTEATSMRLPLWITASCDIMPFDGQTDNIGEKSLLNKKGGSIAFFGTSRTVFMDRNLIINRAFIKYVLGTDKNGNRIPMGEAVRLAKNELVDAKTDRTVNKLNYGLLGDPALALAVPTLQATVDSINGVAVGGSSLMQIPAGSRAIVKGHIVGRNDFSGVVSIVVRDVEERVECKGNATSDKFVYNDRPNVIYNGRDSVANGQFAVSFVVPYDISYSDASAQILVYAVNQSTGMSAHGVQEGFVMNGTAETGDDGIGPSIYCYLNDRSFVDGGVVNSTPYFYAELTDKDGINSTGNGIGHNMELIIDGDMTKTYVLNSSFLYNFGDYTSGTLGYSIPALDEGKHKLLFRAWDVLNNSSTAELSFVVDPKQEPRLMNIVCTKNPAKTNTRFLITHNRAGSQMDVVLEIFDTSGRILWRRSETAVPTDQSFAIDWDLSAGNGQRLRTGVYLYRVLISSNGSSEASAAQKLIVVGNN